MRSKLQGHRIAVFVAGFLFIYACYAGLPADFNADHPQNVQSFSSLRYSEFIRLILNPLTPAWFYPPSTAEMGYVRPLQFLLLKLYYDFLGPDLYPFQVTAAIGFGLLSAVLWSLIFWLTGSVLYAWLGVSLYASFPSNFILNLSIFLTDFQYFLSLITLGSLFLFARLTYRKKTGGRFLLTLIGWLLLIGTAIKLKSSEKILPFVCFGFLLLRARWILSRLGLKRLAVLIGAFLISLVLVVPLKPFESWRQSGEETEAKLTAKPVTRKDQIAFSFSLKNALQRTFYVPGGGFPLVTVLRSDFPDSLTENYGFFMGWLLWLGLLLLPLILSRTHVEPSRKHGLILGVTWFGVVLIGFGCGLTLGDKRLLNFGYVPSVPILFGILGMVEQSFLRDTWKKHVVRTVIVLAVASTCLANGVMFLKQVGHFGGIQDVLVRAETDIYRDLYGEEPRGLDLYLRHTELEKRVVLVDWYDLPADWFEQAQTKLRSEGKLFFYARSINSEKLTRFIRESYDVALWKQYRFLDAKPWLFRLIKASGLLTKVFEGGKKREVLVYLIK